MHSRDKRCNEEDRNKSKVKGERNAQMRLQIPESPVFFGKAFERKMKRERIQENESQTNRDRDRKNEFFRRDQKKHLFTPDRMPDSQTK